MQRARAGTRPRRGVPRPHRQDGEARAEEQPRAPLRGALPDSRSPSRCCCSSSRALVGAPRAGGRARGAAGGAWRRREPAEPPRRRWSCWSCAVVWSAGSIRPAIGPPRATGCSTRQSTTRPSQKYGEGLVDAPESPLLQFNLAAALYKQGKYDEAIKALEKASRPSGEPKWPARATYNSATPTIASGPTPRPANPQAAIASYEQALAAYKRGMVANAADTDAKFNHEFVAASSTS